LTNRASAAVDKNRKIRQARAGADLPVFSFAIGTGQRAVHCENEKRGWKARLPVRGARLQTAGAAALVSGSLRRFLKSG